MKMDQTHLTLLTLPGDEDAVKPEQTAKSGGGHRMLTIGGSNFINEQWVYERSVVDEQAVADQATALSPIHKSQQEEEKEFQIEADMKRLLNKKLFDERDRIIEETADKILETSNYKQQLKDAFRSYMESTEGGFTKSTAEVYRATRENGTAPDIPEHVQLELIKQVARMDRAAKREDGPMS
mmetsp:Transcript_40636/g.67227  ORF Transcript_40636/g.67227 Transcript_40636/m.67227 type:complete len:182 (+) Transcript_40636:1-546(+)